VCLQNLKGKIPKTTKKFQTAGTNELKITFEETSERVRLKQVNSDLIPQVVDHDDDGGGGKEEYRHKKYFED